MRRDHLNFDRSLCFAAFTRSGSLNANRKSISRGTNGKDAEFAALDTDKDDQLEQPEDDARRRAELRGSSCARCRTSLRS
jgi:hypothetical protein